LIGVLEYWSDGPLLFWTILQYSNTPTSRFKQMLLKPIFPVGSEAIDYSYLISFAGLVATARQDP
jgi:hypothetical protein